MLQEDQVFDESWLAQRRIEGDVMRPTESDLVFKDERYDEAFTERLREPFALVDSVLKDIQTREEDGQPLDVHGRVDAELAVSIKRVIYHIFRTNCELKGKDYTISQLRILIWEMWYVDHLHGVTDYGQKLRNDGSSYSRSHLFGALLNAVTLTGITDLAFLLAILHHDDFEDLKKVHPPRKPQKDKLMISEQYKEDLLDRKKMLKPMHDRLFNLVEGVTNIKGKDVSKRDQEVLNTVDLIRKMLDYEPLVMVVRLCDRLHNLQTLKGMREVGKNESADLKVVESLARLAPTALILGMRELYKGMVEACFLDSNESAIRDFNIHRNAKIVERLFKRINPDDPEKDVGQDLMERLQVLVDDPHVLYLAYKPKSFFEPEYGDPSRIYDNTYSPSKGLDALDPLFRIEVLVDAEENLDAVRTKLLAALTPGSQTGALERRGVHHIHNPRLGRRIEARVRTVREARLAQRGIFLMNSPTGTPKDPQYSLEVKKTMPEDLHARIDRFLSMVKEDTPVSGVQELIREILLQPTQVALTPGEESVELPGGATVVDFALKVHREMLGRCLGAHKLLTPSSGSAISLEPFDMVFKPGEMDPMLEIIKGPEGVNQVKPGWKTYSSLPSTQKSINHRLEQLPRLEQMQLGQEHLLEVSRLLDLPLQVVIELLWPKGGAHPSFSLQELVGSGSLNPLEELSKKVDAKDGINFEVDLPNASGDLLLFLARFGRPFINLLFLEGQKDYVLDGRPRTKLYLCFERAVGDKVPLYDFLSLAYQIRQVYPIKVSSTRFKRLAEKSPVQLDLAFA